MSSKDSNQPTLPGTVRQWWREVVPREGVCGASRRFLRTIREFLCEFTPTKRRQRYGDVDYDWDYRVDTTGATVGWRNRLMGMFLSSYEPTDPRGFQEMLSSLNLRFEDFSFVDLGSGKGRTLLMASDYPFRRIVGVELLPELHAVAQQNIARYKSESQKCLVLESICTDARRFPFPQEPLVLYLFNPLPEPGLAQVISNLEKSIKEHPRAVYILYYNPLLEHVLAASHAFRRVGGTHQYAIYQNIA